MEVVAALAFIGVLISSIMHNPTPHTTVILADNHKSHNAIVVKTDAGSTVIDKSGHYVTLSSKDEKPSSIKKISNEEIRKKFKSAIRALPSKPEHVYLYFKQGTSELTTQSLNKLPHIYELLRRRAPCDLNIIGHTDTKGSQATNLRLSMKRAQDIKKWILSREVDVNNLKVEAYGENDPLIPTKDEVSEPRNRCVELLIR
jgi:outer membrane protein OmpA-like peptidoglycan-associated protein